MRTLPTIAAVIVLALAAGGCGGGDEESAADSETVETTVDEAAGSSFEPYQCQPLIQASSQIRRAVSANEPEQLVFLEPLSMFYIDSGDQLSDEVRADFETVLEPYDEYFNAMMAAGGQADPAQLEGVIAEIDREPFIAAATRINAWANTEC